MKLFRQPSVLSQHVDTLKSGFISIDADAYVAKYIPLLDELEYHKQKAQAIESFDDKARFAIIEDFSGFGRFRCYAKGGHRYPYMVENDDMMIGFSTMKSGGDTPQIKIHFYAHYLFAKGHRACYAKACEMADAMLGASRKICSELHLATDVYGMAYDELDKLRFQTNFHSTEHIEMKKYSAKQKLTGFQFGKGDFLFRIYDKTLEIQKNVSKSFIRLMWILNGYDIDGKLPVFRHEIQYRREVLKKFIPNRGIMEDENLHLFDILESLWYHAISKVEYVNLTDSEVVRIKESGKTETIRSIYYRAKKDQNRFHLWDTLRRWENSFELNLPISYEDIKRPQLKVAYKQLKGFISSMYKITGGDPDSLHRALDAVDKELMHYEGITLHENALLKVVDSFVRNERVIRKHNIADAMNIHYAASEAYRRLKSSLHNIEALENKKELAAYEREMRRIDSAYCHEDDGESGGVDTGRDLECYEFEEIQV